MSSTWTIDPKNGQLLGAGPYPSEEEFQEARQAARLACPSCGNRVEVKPVISGSPGGPTTYRGSTWMHPNPCPDYQGTRHDPVNPSLG